jgi:DNA-binding NtrC family response regulator
MMNLLLVEDDKEVVRVLTKNLQSRYIVISCGSIRECLEILSKPPLPDVILLDLRLEDVSGLTAVARLQEHHPDIPVIVLTGFFSEEDAKKAIEMGAQDYLIKPVRAADIDAAVIKAIARHRVRLRYDPIRESMAELKTACDSLPPTPREQLLGPDPPKKEKS